MKIISPRGDYSARRAAAKAAGALVHLQYHFNSGGGSYSLTEITSAADTKCRELAQLLVADFAVLFGIRNGGVRTLAPGERGYSCIGNELPGIILEPFFGDSLSQAKRARAVQAQLDDVIARRIQDLYPATATIALTLGHKYKTSNPYDRGASLAGGGNEASYMEPVLEDTRALLEGPPLSYVFLARDVTRVQRAVLDHVIAQLYDFPEPLCAVDRRKGEDRLKASGKLHSRSVSPVGVRPVVSEIALGRFADFFAERVAKWAEEVQKPEKVLVVPDKPFPF